MIKTKPGIEIEIGPLASETDENLFKKELALYKKLTGEPYALARRGSLLLLERAINQALPENLVFCTIPEKMFLELSKNLSEEDAEKLARVKGIWSIEWTIERAPFLQ